MTSFNDPSASRYRQQKTDEVALELCADLRKAFIYARLENDRQTLIRRMRIAFDAFEAGLTLDRPDHPFASLAPQELAAPLSALLSYTDEEAMDDAAEIRRRAETLLCMLTKKAQSAREIHHAMLVRMSRVGKRMVDPPHHRNMALDKSAALHELTVLIRLQSLALARIRTKRLASFIRSLATATRNALRRIMSSEHSPEPLVQHVSEATLIGAVTELVHVVIEMGPHDVDALEVLRDYMLHTLALVASSPPLTAVLAENYFRKCHPRFQTALPVREADLELVTRAADEEAWNLVKIAARELKLGSQGLFSIASRHDMAPPGPPKSTHLSISSVALAMTLQNGHNVPPLSSQGAFVLLAHLLADPLEQEGLIGGWYAIRCTLPHIMAALGGVGGLAVDEALFWLLWCFDHGLHEREGRAEEVDEATLYPLVETLSGLAARSPTDHTRFLAFRLLCILICNFLTLRDDLQLVLISDLIGTAPYPLLQAASIGLLRDLVIDRLGNRDKSLFSSPVLVTELGPQIMQCRPADLSQVTVEDFIRQAHLQNNAERLGLIYAVITADERNRTTLRSQDRLRKIREDLLDPIRRAIKRWRVEADLNDQDVLSALNVLSLQLELAEGAVSRHQK